MHKRSRTSDGKQGVCWWNVDYWEKELMVKKEEDIVKKEEPSTPLLNIKVEPPPSPKLE